MTYRGSASGYRRLAHCPVLGCLSDAARDLPLCAEHWTIVPLTLKADVRRYAVGTKEHAELVQRVVLAVAAEQSRLGVEG